jgi:hemolysin activation/secretion protein
MRDRGGLDEGARGALPAHIPPLLGVLLLGALSSALAAGPGGAVAQAGTSAAAQGGVAAQPGASPPAAAATEVFPVNEYLVLHNTVLDVRTVEKAVYPYLGPGKTLQDVQGARAALEAAYHAAGYNSVFVDIPEQSIANNVVRLAVTEGRIEKLRVSGERYVSGRSIKAAVPSLAPGTVPHFPDVQRQLNDVNRQSADLTVVPVLRAGQAPGTIDADLKVKDQLPLHGSAEVNNRNTPETTPTRVTVTASYANLFQSYQSLSLLYQVAPERSSDGKVFAATYVAPLGPGGPTLAFFALDTNSDVAAIGTLSVIGKGQIYGSRYIWPLTIGGNTSQSLTFGVDYKDFGQNVLLLSGTGLQTPIKYMNWLVGYAATLPTPHTHTTLDLEYDFGIRGVVNQPQEFENNRYLAPPNYFYLKVGATHERDITHDWRLAVRMNSQYTTQPLIPNEQFAIGGLESVRGYLESEALGDYGISGSLELRTPSAPWLRRAGANEAYAYLFTDAGVAALIDPLPTQIAKTNMWSWGGGLRINALWGLRAGLNVARAEEATLYTRAGEVRFLFDFLYGF